MRTRLKNQWRSLRRKANTKALERASIIPSRHSHILYWEWRRNDKHRGAFDAIRHQKRLFFDLCRLLKAWNRIVPQNGMHIHAADLHDFLSLYKLYAMNIGFEQIIQVFRMNGTSILVEYNKHSGRAEHAFLLNGTSILLKRSIYSGQNGPTFNITGLSVFLYHSIS